MDLQNDFCEGGALPVRGASHVVERVVEYLSHHSDRYALIIASRDWHRGDYDNDGHFAAEGQVPDLVTTWPLHCIQGTEGARYHPAFAALTGLIHVQAVKGDGKRAFSAFEAVTEYGDQSLRDVLREAGIDRLEIAGLATDCCVCATALDARAEGYDTTVLIDLCAESTTA